MPFQDILLALVVQVLWGLNYVAAKLAVTGLPPLMFTTLRFCLAAALVVPFFPMPRGRALLGVLALSFTFGTIHFGLQFLALPYVDAADAAVILQTGVPFTTLLGVFILKETVHWRRIVGLVMAFAGVVVIAGEPHLTSIGPVLLLLVAAIGWAFSNMIVKFTQGVEPLAVTGWLSLFAIPQVAFLSWLLEDGQFHAIQTASWQTWAGLVYTALGASIAAHSIWYALLRRHPIGVVAPWGLVAPVLGIAAGIFVLGEAATWQKLVGGAIALSGVAIIQTRQIRRGRPVIGAANPEATRDPVPTLVEMPSANFDARPANIKPDLLVLHYTGMRTSTDALQRMCDPEAKVSAHYMVEENGRVIRLVQEEQRAWHAGVSCWEGRNDVNSRSIGVEIVNPGHEFGYRPFPEAQMAAVVALCRDIVDRNHIQAGHVLAHSDVAPTRKEDPGELFDWRRLADAGIGLWPRVAPRTPAPRDAEALAALSAIGYDLRDPTAAVVAFQRRFRPHCFDGIIDPETAALAVAMLIAVRESAPDGGLSSR